jgi:hypothetical protein
VWVDLKRKSGINQGMLTAITSSSYILLLLSQEYIEQILTMETQQQQQPEDHHVTSATAATAPPTAATAVTTTTSSHSEYTSYFQFVFSLKQKNVIRVLPVMLEDRLSRGWEMEVSHEMVLEQYSKIQKERERRLADEEEEEGEGEQGGGGVSEGVKEGMRSGMPSREAEEEVAEAEEDEDEETNLVQIDAKEYEQIRKDLLQQRQEQECGWKGLVGKYLFEYTAAIAATVTAPTAPSSSSPVAPPPLSSTHSAAMSCSLKKRFFFSNELVTEVERELRERQREREEEDRRVERQRQLEEEQLRRKKKKELKKGMMSRMMSDGLIMDTQPQTSPSTLPALVPVMATATAAVGSFHKPTEDSNATVTETSLMASEAAETEDGLLDHPTLDTTTGEKSNQILLNIEQNELLQLVINCAITMARQSATSSLHAPTSTPLLHSATTAAAAPAPAPLLMKILAQLHECHRLLMEMIEKPVNLHSDLWLDDSLLPTELKWNQQGNQTQDRDHPSPSSSSTGHEARVSGGEQGSTPPSPSASSSPYLSSPSPPARKESDSTQPSVTAQRPLALLPSARHSSSSSSPQHLSFPFTNLTSFHPLIPMSSDYHLKYKPLYTLTSAEVTHLFAALKMGCSFSPSGPGSGSGSGCVGQERDEITGMVLQHCLTTDDLLEIGMTSVLRAREMLTFLSQMKLFGVPVEYLEKAGT